MKPFFFSNRGRYQFHFFPAGAKGLLSNKVTDIEVENLGCAQSAAEGAVLGVYKYQAQKAAEKCSPTASVNLAEGDEGRDEWNLGKQLANSQNWARFLMESPANLMTPRIFAENVIQKLKNRVEVVAHDRKWAEDQRMGAFLSVSRGSIEEPVFLELTYNGAGDSSKPICLVGKGITFDSGGISLKPGASMDLMRADMGGAACVVAALDSLSQNKIPVNVKGEFVIHGRHSSRWPILCPITNRINQSLSRPHSPE